MLKPETIQLRKLIRQMTISALLVISFGLTFASTGGGGDKKNNNHIPLRSEFVPIRTTNNFTLKAGPSYRGSYTLGEEKTKNVISVNTLITYQKGNSTYIIPYKFKVNSSLYIDGSPDKNNLRMLDFRIRMH